MLEWNTSSPVELEWRYEPKLRGNVKERLVNEDNSFFVLEKIYVLKQNLLPQHSVQLHLDVKWRLESLVCRQIVYLFENRLFPNLALPKNLILNHPLSWY